MRSRIRSVTLDLRALWTSGKGRDFPEGAATTSWGKAMEDGLLSPTNAPIFWRHSLKARSRVSAESLGGAGLTRLRVSPRQLTERIRGGKHPRSAALTCTRPVCPFPIAQTC